MRTNISKVGFRQSPKTLTRNVNKYDVVLYIQCNQRKSSWRVQE